MSTYLLKNGTVVTCIQGKAGVCVLKADVLVEGNTITKIESNIAASGAVVIDCTDKWITPGFVDTHRHVFMTVLRASQCDWLLTEYLVKMSWSMQGDLSPEEIAIGTLAGCLDALHNGVTSILDHFHAAHTPEHFDAALRATCESGARVVWAPARQSPPTRLFPFPEWANDTASAEWQAAKLQEAGAATGGRLRPDGRVTLGLAYDTLSNGADVQVHKDFVGAARKIPVSIITAHVLNDKGFSINAWKDAGLLGPDLVFSHCCNLQGRPALDDASWQMLKESGAGIGSTPEDELGMAHGHPVGLEAQERGVKCGLGVDVLSANSGDIFMQMRTQLQWSRGNEHRKVREMGGNLPLHNKWNSEDVFRLGTLGGAETLNLSHLIGTVEVGKRADLVVFDANSVNLGGALDPINGVVFHASSEDVEMVFVDGEIVKKDSKLVRDWAPVAKELKQRAEDIRKRWPVETLEQRWKQWYENTNGANMW